MTERRRGEEGMKRERKRKKGGRKGAKKEKKNPNSVLSGFE